MSAIPRPHRDAQLGEIVLFYETGDPSSTPLPMIVAESGKGWATLTGLKAGEMTPVRRHYVKHIHDVFWDTATVSQKQKNGAYDFHPVYRSMFDKWLAAEHARQEARKQREAEQTAGELSTDEFNAINALERHGDNMSAIKTDTGLTDSQLKKLTKFMEALNKVREEAFHLKQEAKAGK